MEEKLFNLFTEESNKYKLFKKTLDLLGSEVEKTKGQENLKFYTLHLLLVKLLYSNFYSFSYY